MAFGDTFLEVILRGAAHFFGDILLERVCRGTGDFLLRYLPLHVNSGGTLSLVLGGLFWFAMAAGLYHLFSVAGAAMEVDRCLDAGGRWNAADSRCEFIRSQ